jgi:hypothetical protein
MSSQFDLGKLVTAFGTMQDQVTAKISELNNASTNVNVADYMKLQLMMNSLSQIGTLVTNTVQSVNKMVQQAINAFPTH